MINEQQAEFILDQLLYLENNYRTQQEYYLAEIEEIESILIDIMVAQDMYDILEGRSESFLEDVLKGEYWTPYTKLKSNQGTNAIIVEFNSHTSISGSAKDFIYTINYIISGNYSITQNLGHTCIKLYEILKLINILGEKLND